LEVGRKRQWLSDGMEEEIKSWLSSMLYTIDITSDKAESYLKTFLSSKMNSVTKLYGEHIKRAVRHIVFGIGTYYLYWCLSCLGRSEDTRKLQNSLSGAFSSAVQSLPHLAYLGVCVCVCMYLSVCVYVYACMCQICS